MLSSVRGVVIGFSSTWKPGRYASYKKILLGFPDDEAENLWCTVWGPENWGHEDSPSGESREVVLRRGLVVEMTGRMERDRRNFTIKSDGTKRGGFSILSEYRKYRLVLIQSSQWIVESGFVVFETETPDGQRFRGRLPLPLRLNGRNLDPAAGSAMTIDGSPVLVDRSPDVWLFDRGSNPTVLAMTEV